MDIINAVAQVGFPVVGFLIAAWFIKYTYDRSMDQNEKSMDKIGSLADAVNTNTNVLADLANELKEMMKKWKDGE